MAAYKEGDAVRQILLKSLDGGATWVPIENPVGAGGSGGNVVITDPTTATDQAPVSSATPAGTEKALYVRVVSQPAGGAGGTQYVEDVAAVADPTATALAIRRRDALVSEVTTDGDWITANSTSKGEQYVKHVDPIPVTQSGAWAAVGVTGPLTDAQLRATAVPVDTEFPAAAAMADAVANPTVPAAAAHGMLWNGTTWDRARSGSPTANPGSAGVQAVQLHFSNGSTIVRWMNNNADGEGASAAPVVDNMLYNGTTWDRMRGDITNGLDVDVTRVSGTVITDPSDRAARLLGKARLTDGTTDTVVKAASTAAVAADPALVVAVSPNNTVPVSGTFWQGTQPVSLAAAVDVSDRAARLVGVVDTELPAAAALADATANPTAPAAAAFAMAWNGTNWDRVKSTSGAVWVTGDVAHDDVNTLSTLQIGGHASNPDTPPTAVSAAGDRARMWVDKYGVVVMRQRKVRETYIATYRLAETTTALYLSKAMTANTTHQLATLHHAATATKELQVFWVGIKLISNSAATAGLFEIRKINTAPVTGNPAITPGAFKDNAAATEAIALALPTTAGTEVNVNVPYGSVTFNLGITGVASTVNPPALAEKIDLYNFDEASDSAAPLTLRAGQLQGIAVVGRCVAATTLLFSVQIIYAEETL